MDVLNNIWNLLTVENETLTKIVTAPMVIIEAWILFELSVSIFKLDHNSKNKFFYITLMSLNSLLTIFVIPSPYNVFVNYFFIFLITKLTFKINIFKSILVFISTISIFALVGALILKPFLLILNIDYCQVECAILYRLLYLAAHYGLSLLIIFLIGTKNLDFPSTSSFNSIANKKLIFLNILLGLFTLCIQQIVIAFYADILPIQISFLSFLSLLIYLFISFYSLVKTMKLQLTTLELKNAESYNKTLSILYDNVKAFKHDFDNMVFTIGGFINTNDIEGLKKYYDSLEKECQHLNNVAILNPTLINNPGIYNLIAAKYQKAKNENVEIQLDFFFDLNKLHMPIYDFSRMLGIFLDNAIEAANSSDEKIIKILFRDTTKSNVQIIQIENSYKNKNVDIKSIFEKGISEKDNHLGMGLWEVNKIIRRNNNVNLITEKDDLYFKQRIEIYY